MMDVATMLTFFDRWQARHKQTCRIQNLDVSAERIEHNGAEVTRLVLKCPVCKSTISNVIADADWPQVVALLDPKRAS